MTVIYSPRATRDLEKIAAYYRINASPQVAAAIAERIELVIERRKLGARCSDRSHL